MLAVLEAIASEQPIGATALAKLLATDKSAVQRSLVTLARAGWIAPTPERQVRWELSAHLFSLARLPRSSEDLRRRAMPILAELRDRTEETAFLAIPDLKRFIVVEVAESRQTLRAVLRVGEPIPPEKSATSRAILASLGDDERAGMLGRAPSDSECAQFEDVRRKGFAVSIDEVLVGSTNIAAPVIDAGGRALAAIALSAPTDRLDAGRREEIGALLAQSARRLARSPSDKYPPRHGYSELSAHA